MTDRIEQLEDLLGHTLIHDGLRALAIVLAGYLIALMVRRRAMASPLRARHRALLLRVVSWSIYGVSFTWALAELGLNVGVLLGAAGVLTIAVGFAAQTAVSNLISGLFLLVEQPFHLDDLIQVGGTTGQVIAIDLLSTKLRTFDNLYVRIPNESMLKAQVTNMTHFPIRRCDIQIGVAYKEDIRTVRDILMEVAEENPLCLEEPRALLIFRGYGDSSIDLQFSVWTTRKNFLELKNKMHESIKYAFDDRGIEIPFPHRTLYAGSETLPMPIRAVGTDQEQSGDAPRA